MIFEQVSAGDVVVTNFPGFQHWSIASDRRCAAGKPYLISATSRTGSVYEEPWDIVTSGNPSYLVDIELKLSPSERLRRARSEIGHWSYHLASRNCEHFVKWSGGVKVVSKQVVSGFFGAAVGALVSGLVTRKPLSLKGLGVAVVTAYAAVTSARAAKHPSMKPTKRSILMGFSPKGANE